MRAFRIEKNTQLHNVLKACDKIAKTKRGIEKYTHIYYDAENKTVFATNGYVLLTYKTDEIIKLLGDDIGKGILSICGDFVIFEDKKEDLFNYLLPIEKHKDFKKFHTDFSDSYKPYYSQAVIELALNGITMNPNILKDLEPIAMCLDYVSLQEDKYGTVIFSGLEDRLKFVALPYCRDRWRPYLSDDEKKID